MSEPMSLEEYAEKVLSDLGYRKTTIPVLSGEMPLFTKNIRLFFSKNLPRVSLMVCVLVEPVMTAESWKFTQKATLTKPNFKIFSRHEGGIAKSLVGIAADKINSTLINFPIATEYEQNANLEEELYRLIQASVSLPVENIDLYFEVPVLLTTAEIDHSSKFGGDACITCGLVLNNAGTTKNSVMIVHYTKLREFASKLEEEITK